MRKTGSLLAALVVGSIVAAGPAPIAFAQEAAGAAAEASSIPGTQAFEEAQEQEGVRALADCFRLGGFIMYFLVACSIVALALALERAWSLRRGQVIPRAFTRQLRDHVFRHEISKIQELCGPARSSISTEPRTTSARTG